MFLTPAFGVIKFFSRQNGAPSGSAGMAFERHSHLKQRQPLAEECEKFGFSQNEKCEFLRMRNACFSK